MILPVDNPISAATRERALTISFLIEAIQRTLVRIQDPVGRAILNTLISELQRTEFNLRKDADEQSKVRYNMPPPPLQPKKGPPPPPKPPLKPVTPRSPDVTPLAPKDDPK